MHRIAEKRLSEPDATKNATAKQNNSKGDSKESIKGTKPRVLPEIKAAIIEAIEQKEHGEMTSTPLLLSLLIFTLVQRYASAAAGSPNQQHSPLQILS